MRISGGADLRVKRIIFGANAAAVNLINHRDRYADIAQRGDVKVFRVSRRCCELLISVGFRNQAHYRRYRAAQIDGP